MLHGRKRTKQEDRGKSDKSVDTNPGPQPRDSKSNEEIERPTKKPRHHGPESHTEDTTRKPNVYGYKVEIDGRKGRVEPLEMDPTEAAASVITLTREGHDRFWATVADGRIIPVDSATLRSMPQGQARLGTLLAQELMESRKRCRTTANNTTEHYHPNKTQRTIEARKEAARPTPTQKREREHTTGNTHNLRRRLPDTLWIAPLQPDTQQHNHHHTFLQSYSTSTTHSPRR